MKSLSAIRMFGFALVMLGVIACEKDGDPLETQLHIAEDHAIAEAYFGLVLNEAGNAWVSAAAPAEGVDPGVVNASETALPVQLTAPATLGDRRLTIRTVPGQSSHPGFPVEVTVAFTNWKIGQGPVKNGSIRIVATGPIIIPGTSITLSFQNFTIDGNAVEGNKTLTNVNGLTFNLALVGGKITFTDGTTITRASNITLTWTAGFVTLLRPWDDEFSISGSGTGTTRKGAAYAWNISKPLILKLSCFWLVEGAITFTHGDNSFVLDYGNGACDDLATISAHGITKEITLPRTPPARKR